MRTVWIVASSIWLLPTQKRSEPGLNYRTLARDHAVAPDCVTVKIVGQPVPQLAFFQDMRLPSLCYDSHQLAFVRFGKLHPAGQGCGTNPKA